jgi:hypothetical protein
VALTVPKLLAPPAPTHPSAKVHRNVLRLVTKTAELRKLFATATSNAIQRLLRLPAKVPTVYKPTLPAAPHGPDVKRRSLAQ